MSPVCMGMIAIRATISRMTNQYAGNNREIRETANWPGLRPHALIQMTYPLIRKNISTPSQP